MNRLEVLVLLGIACGMTYLLSCSSIHEGLRITEEKREKSTELKSTNESDKSSDTTDAAGIDTAGTDTAGTDTAGTDAQEQIEKIKEEAKIVRIENELLKNKIIDQSMVVDLSKVPPDQFLNRDPRGVQSVLSLQDTAAALHTMTPQFLNERLAESDYKFRWIEDEWPKCEDRCSSQARRREVKCFERNSRPYSDDISMFKLYTKDANEKDQFGRTKCDYQLSGININVKPAEVSFCSLINNCSVKDTTQLLNERTRKEVKTPTTESKVEYIGFKRESLQQIPNLSNKTKILVERAFPIQKSIVKTGIHTEFLFVKKTDLELFMKSLTLEDKENIVKVLQQMEIVTESSTSYDVDKLLSKVF